MLLDRIESLCKEKDITFYALLKETKLSSYAYEWKKGTKEPTFKAICKICVCLNISLSEFFVGYNNSELTSSQKEILKYWHQLSPKEKALFLKIIENFDIIKFTK